MAEISWLTVAQLSLVTGILTTLLNHGFGIWLSRGENRRRAAYLALRSSIVLEKFAVDCLIRAYTDSEAPAHGGHELPSEMPPLAPFPADADWKDIKPEHANRIMSLQNEIAASEALSEYGSHWENDKASSINEAIRFGRRALLLADDLRRHYRLGATSVSDRVRSRIESGIF